MAHEGTRRDGLYSLVKTAHTLCTFITFFTPIISRLYGANLPLMAALAAANSACEELARQASAQKEEGV